MVQPPIGATVAFVDCYGGQPAGGRVVAHPGPFSLWVEVHGRQVFVPLSLVREAQASPPPPSPTPPPGDLFAAAGLDLPRTR